MTGARWDVGEPLALASEIPNLGYDLDQFAPATQDWSADTTWIINAAIAAASAAGGGEIVVRSAGRIYHWLAVQMASNVGIRFIGNPTIRKSGGAASTHILEFLGTESSVSSALVVNHPLTSPLTVTGASWAASVATITVGTHQLLPGDWVQTTGITPSGYNHFVAVTTVTGTTFSFALTTNPGAYTSGGTVNVMPFNIHPTSASGFAVGDIVCIMDETFVYELSPTVSITAASWSGGIATVTFSGSPQTAAGDPIHITGVSSSGPGFYNGVFMTLSRSANTVTYSLQTNPGTWSSGGTGIICEGQTLELARVTATTGNQVVIDRALKRSAYATASNARLVKLNAVSGAYLIGPVRFENPDGTLGGNIYWRYAYDCRVDKVNAYGSNDDPAFYTVRSGRIDMDGCRAYEGQRLDLGGVGYGFAIGSSSHDIRVTNWETERVRENQATNGAMDVVFEFFSVEWTYDDAINTHGSGCRRIRIANGKISGGRAAGVTVAFGTSRAADYDIDIENIEVFDCLGSGVAAKGNSDGTKNPQGVRIKNVKVIRCGGSYGVLLQRCDDSFADDVTVIGGVAGQIGIYAANGDNVRVRRYDVDSGGSDHGVVWDSLTGASEIGPGSVRNVTAHRLWGQNSAGLYLWPSVLDTTDVLLEGSEILIGHDAVAGSLQTTHPDTDITPDPLYRFQVWPVSASRTVNAPTATKRAVGQRITIDIENTGVAPIVPVWNAVFVLSKPLELAAP